LRFPTVSEYTSAYRAGWLSPSKLMSAWHSAQQDLQAEVLAFISIRQEDIEQQTEIAEQRYASRQRSDRSTLGPLDGVPIGIKDEIDVQGYATTLGVPFDERSTLKQRDATCVSRLRKYGAMIVGKLNMHELGLGSTGSNIHFGTARNPFDLRRVAGGSSSGSAVAVATGLCPFAIGADGGGSIRIPAGLCGVFGLKPTSGRVPETGVGPLNYSIGHVGPLASSVEDLRLALSIISGIDAHDPKTVGARTQPTLETQLAESDSRGLSGKRIGYDAKWLSFCEQPVMDCVEAGMKQLESFGCQLVPITLPSDDIIRPVAYSVLGTELVSAQRSLFEKRATECSAEAQLYIQMSSSILAVDYIHALRLRQQIAMEVESLFQDVDMILSPTCGQTAPLYVPEMGTTGLRDDLTLKQLTRYTFLGNMTGIPAISIPIGLSSEDGMPVGLQLMANHWQEALLLTAAQKIESQGPPIKLARIRSRHVDVLRAIKSV